VPAAGSLVLRRLLDDTFDMISSPLIPDVGVIALVPDYWGTCWQSRHHVLTRLARFFPVVWMDPAHYWREMLAAREFPCTLPDTLCSYPGFSLYVPDRWLPSIHHPAWLAHTTFQLRLKRACNLLVQRKCKKIILYIWRPEFAAALNAVPFDVSCYHIDDEYSFSDVEGELDPVEKALITKVDQVFIHSPGLMARKGTINPHTAFVPNGVDFRAYVTPKPEPEDLAVIRRPRIGYTGYIKKQLDWPLLVHLANRHPEWSFVFVGPYSPHPQIERLVTELTGRDNVHFLGAKPFDKLPGYAQHFDVCIMPCQLNAYTDNIYPLKLHEYLASGRPIVSAPIRSLRDFSSVITLASGIDEWSCALTRSLEPAITSIEAVTARQEIAHKYDWNNIVYMIAQTLCRRMGSHYEHRLLQASKSIASHNSFVMG
jgi:glycosyltransferase involved in cell wall biosynthesis